MEPGLNEKEKKFWHQLWNDLPSLFQPVQHAFALTLVLLVLSIAGYVAMHLCFPAPRPDWGQAVQLSNELLFKPLFCQSVLERYISPNDMTEFKKGISDRCEDAARYAVRERQIAFEQISILAQEGLAHKRPPFILQKTPDQKTENDYRYVLLGKVAEWLQTNRVTFAPDRRGEVDLALGALRGLEEREQRLRQELEMQIDCLKPILAFNWLYIDDARWIIELVAWCYFGVLANTIIKLIGVMRDDKYQAREFCLIFPKAILAPVLAMVITALWASGLSDSRINFTNLPYLLVLFFLLGFATENLYEKVVGLAELLVTRSATASQARLEMQAKQSRYQYTTDPVAVSDLPPPKTIVELESKLKEVAKAAFERGIVARLGKNE